MTDRPDLDRDAQRLHEKDDFWRWIDAAGDELERRLVLGHFATAFLYAAIRADLRGLKDRGISAPILLGQRDSGWTLRSPDLLREVACAHPFGEGHVSITYAIVERGVVVPRERRELPIHPTHHARLPVEARRSADEIRAFLLHGELPGPLVG